jgi:hypothetical protein
VTEYTYRVPSGDIEPQPSHLEDGFEADLQMAGSELSSYPVGVARAQIDAIHARALAEAPANVIEFTLHPTIPQEAGLLLSRLTKTRIEDMRPEDKPFLKEDMAA